METKSETSTKTNTKTQYWVPYANEISPETIVNLLVKKGICTANEIYSLEGKIRDDDAYPQNNAYVNIKNADDMDKFSTLKKIMSKHSITRKIGVSLFGWKWKRIKKK